MAVIAIPPGVRSIDWTLPERASFLVVSGWTGSQTAGDLGANRSGFTAEIQVVAGRLEHAAAWRGFFMALRGPINTFALDPSSGNQLTRPMALVAVVGAGQTGAALNVDGALNNLPMLVRMGDIVSINGRAHVVTANVGTSGTGTATLALEPPIVVAPADNAAVIIQSPSISMRLASSSGLGWANEPGDLARPFSFQAVEVLA